MDIVFVYFTNEQTEMNVIISHTRHFLLSRVRMTEALEPNKIIPTAGPALLDLLDVRWEADKETAGNFFASFKARFSGTSTLHHVTC